MGDNCEGLIEIGMVTIGHLDSVDDEAVRRTVTRLQSRLSTIAPEFHWRLSLVEREDVPVAIRHEPSALLRDGAGLREAKGWDFAILFTSAELVSRYKRYALAATSSTLDLAIISTNRIDPVNSGVHSDTDLRIDVLTKRLTALCLRSIGHLTGLPPVSDAKNIMNTPKTPLALDEMEEVDAGQYDNMKENLRLIADPRLEESSDSRNLSKPGFYLRSTWINRHEIIDAIVQASPWEFPFRLLRLTAAAVSTMMILKITAETWDLSASLSGVRLGFLLLATIIFTTTFVTIRQGLLVNRMLYRVTEQSVVSNVASVLIVFCGMVTSALLLILVSQGVCYALYSDRLIASWRDVTVMQIDWLYYLKTSLVVTIMGLWIGALGASFEDQHHFRHTVFVDEEV